MLDEAMEVWSDVSEAAVDVVEEGMIDCTGGWQSPDGASIDPRGPMLVAELLVIETGDPKVPSGMIGAGLDSIPLATIKTGYGCACVDVAD